MGNEVVVYTFNEMLLIYKKEQSTNTYATTWINHKSITLREKKPETKGDILRDCFYMIHPEYANPEIESKLEVTWGWEEGRLGTDYLMDMGCF